MKLSVQICLTCLLMLCFIIFLSGCANFTLDVVATYQTDTVLEAKKAAKAEEEKKQLPYYGVVR